MSLLRKLKSNRGLYSQPMSSRVTRFSTRAATRPSRTVVPQTHQRIASNETDASSLMESISLGSFGAQSYNDHDLAGAANVEFLPPEYAVIPMSARGKDTLTVKLAMFCLSLMAAGGCGNVDYGYPPLDSWRCVDCQGFIHNTSNLGTKKLPNNAVRYETQEYEPEDVRSEASSDNEVSQSGQVAPGTETIDSRIHQEYHEGQSKVGQEGPGASPSRTESKPQLTEVDVKKRDGRLCFRDVKGELGKTKRKEWTPVSGGWIFHGKKHFYFTKRLPKD